MKKMLLILYAVVLCACSSTLSTHYYQLPESAFRLPERRGATTGVRVVLSDALRGDGLLYQVDEVRVHVAQQHRWLAPLDEELARAFSFKLNQLGERVYVPQIQQSGENMVIYIHRFQGTYLGETEIVGYAQSNNGTLCGFEVRTPQHGDGYAAMLASLNAGLDTVAQKIVSCRER